MLENDLAVVDGTGIIGEFEAEVRRGGLGRRYVLSQSSGTAALHAAYFGAGFGPGDEVLVPSMGFHATTTVLLAMQVCPVFVDVTESGLPTASMIESTWSGRTAGMVVTHLWGLAHDLGEIAECVDSLGGRLVEDCSHSLGATGGGRPAGTWGFVAATSLHATKPLATSEGGLLTTDDRTCYERALVLGHGGPRAVSEVTDPTLAEFASTGLGWKHRISAPSAALGVAAIRAFADRLALRRDGVHRFVGQLHDACSITPAFAVDQIDRSTWYRVPLRLTDELAGRSHQVSRGLLSRGVPVITDSLMGSLSRVPVLRRRTSAFPWLPDGWGCHPGSARGSLALQNSTVLLDPDALARGPEAAADACNSFAGA